MAFICYICQSNLPNPTQREEVTLDFLDFKVLYLKKKCGERLAFWVILPVKKVLAWETPVSFFSIKFFLERAGEGGGSDQKMFECLFKFKVIFSLFCQK